MYCAVRAQLTIQPDTHTTTSHSSRATWLSVPRTPLRLSASHSSQAARQQPAGHGHCCPQGLPQQQLSPAGKRRLFPPAEALSVAAPGATSSGSSSSGPHLGWLRGFNAKYTLGNVLGRGSFGTVHEATHKQSGNSYAVKVLQKVGRDGGAVQLEAIRQEVATWSQAQGSKFVAKLEGLYEDEHNAYIVQELCAGGDLKSLLDANGCFSELETATIMRGVLDVLAECHRRSICYGDVKPANFLLTTTTAPRGASAAALSPQKAAAPRVTVRAVDFGCSRLVRKQGALSQQCGTPLYMAPEMAHQRFGHGVDVWAAGVMMYQMLTGKVPFWLNKTMGDISKLPPWEIIAAVRTHEVSFPRDVWCQWSPHAADLVSRMLDRNPATRISAEEALGHPWFQDVLGYTPSLSGEPAGNNVLSFPHHHAHAAAAAAAEAVAMAAGLQQLPAAESELAAEVRRLGMPVGVLGLAAAGSLHALNSVAAHAS